MNKNHYILLAELFRYPSESLTEHCQDWTKMVSEYDPRLVSDLKPFITHISNKSLAKQQEYYVSTFDVQPLCCLDIGYALFGEDYRRGRLLANLKAEHRKAGNDCGTELPDNLTVLLTLLPEMNDIELAEEIACSLIIPAIKKIIAGFRSESNCYKPLLKIVLSILEKEFQSSKYQPFETAKI